MYIPSLVLETLFPISTVPAVIFPANVPVAADNAPENVPPAADKLPENVPPPFTVKVAPSNVNASHNLN